MELRRYLHLVRLRAWLIVATVLAGLAAGYLVTPRVPVYEASSTIYVGTKDLPIGTGALSNVAAGLLEISTTFSAMIPSKTIAEGALAQTGVRRRVKTVVSETRAAVLPATNLIKVSVRDTDKSYAQKLADGMSDSFVREIATFDYVPPASVSRTSPTSIPSQPAYVFEHASTPSKALPNGLIRNLNLGWIFGIVLSVTIIFLLDYLDITVKGPDELERRVGLPVLGIIPVQRQLRSGLSPVATPRRSVVSGEPRG